MVDPSAIIQGAGTALAIVALVALYIDRMSKISNNLETISDSIADVNDDIRRVDLKSMEKTTNKLESFLDAELQQSYSGRSRTGGENSVRYDLDQNDIEAIISWVGDPDWHAGLRTRSEYDGSEMVFEVKFDQELDTQAIVGRLESVESLHQYESENFDDTPARLLADSPYQISCAIPSSDMDEAGDYISILIDEIDDQISFIRESSELFDESVEKSLND